MSYHDDSPDEEWVEDDDSEAELLICPVCHREVYEETQQCPHCSHWITPAYEASGFRRAWLVAIVLLLVLALLLVYVF